jgi:hypothetical protein
MGFKLVKIDGGTTAGVVQTNDATVEAVISNFVAYNNGGVDQAFTLYLDGVEIISESVSADSSYRLPDKFNIPANTELTITTDANVTATISVYVGAIDTAGAMTIVQQASQDAVDAEASISPYYSDISNITNNLEDIQNASANAILAKDSSDIAVATSNNKGSWENLTGSLSVPASVVYGGKVWILLNDMADVTASVPSIDNTDWEELTVGSSGTDTNYATVLKFK